MSWRENPSIFKVGVWTFIALLLAGCGVKGDPLPPERPPRMGRGRPTYRKAAEKIKIENGTEKDSEDEQRN